MSNKTGWSLFIVLLLAACGSLPKTPAEFRQGLQANANNSGISIDKFEVALPYAQVANFMKLKSNKCLNVTIEKTGRNYKGLDVTVTNRYESFSAISNKAAEIYATRTTVLTMQGDQKFFLVLADLYPISNSRTKVELYYYTSLGGQFGKAYKSWALGQAVDCPDYN